MKQEHLRRAAELCALSYKWGKDPLNEDAFADPANPWQPAFWRSVNLYVLRNEIFAFVRFETDADERRSAYVVFRGTEGTLAKSGNWVFANLQAHKTRYQDPAFPTPGTVHMGFYRAFFWLWKKGEPVVDEEHEKKRDRYFWRRHVIIGLAIVLTLGLTVVLCLVLLASFPKLSITVVGSVVGVVVLIILAAWLLLILIELGKVERWFMSGLPTHREGGTLSLAYLHTCNEVIFTGHSLGGAMAAMAFAAYQEWPASDGKKGENARLVTFAAPRVGDQSFVNDFECRYRDKYLHIVHAGDLVPEVPCDLQQARSMSPDRGRLRFAFRLIGWLREPYASIYDQTPPGKWRKVFSLGEGRLNLRWHRMKNYLQHVTRRNWSDSDLPG